jgi:carboxymethylenebutenolidase
MSANVASVASETVKLVSDKASVAAFLARPAEATAAPAVLVLHEWWGLNDHIKDIARRLAAEGFAALAIDLYSRQGHKVTANAQEAAELMNALSSQQVLRDLNAAITWLKQQPFIDPQKIGAVGFCMGGTFVLTQATHNSDLKAVVPFYGKVPPIESIARLLCPVLFHWGAKDGWVTRQEVERLQQGLKDHGKRGEVAIYPQADHAFFNNTRPEAYRPEDAVQAWQKTLAFLREYVR